MREIENAERFFNEADALVAYVATNNRLASLLYDVDMLPETLEVGSRPWLQMLIIIAAFRELAEEKEGT